MLELNKIIIQCLIEYLILISKNNDKIYNIDYPIDIPEYAINAEFKSFSFKVDINGIQQECIINIERLVLTEGTVPLTISLKFLSSKNVYIFHKMDEYILSTTKDKIYKAIVVDGNNKVIECEHINLDALRVIACILLHYKYTVETIDPIDIDSPLITNIQETYYV